MARKYEAHIYALAAYLAVAILIFLPIALNASKVANGVGGDVYQSLWDIWWVKYAMLNLHTSIWHTTLLYWPVGTNLVFQTMAPIASLISIPFQSISIVFGFNVLFFLGYALSGLTMFILADYIVRNKYAAFVAGLAFAFSTFHLAHSFGEIGFSNLEWFPLSLYFLLRMMDSKKGRETYISAAGLGVSLMLVYFMSNPELLLLAAIMLAAVLVGYVISKSERSKVLSFRMLKGVAVAGAVLLITGIWGFVPVISAATGGQLSTANYLNTVQYNQIWSDNVLSFFVPGYFNGLFDRNPAAYFTSVFQPDPNESSAFIGYVIIALAAYGVYRTRLGSGTKFWVVFGVVFGWLALGPYPHIGSFVVRIPGLFYLIHSIPVLDIIREPGRFDLMVVIATSILAAIGMKMLFENHAFFKGKEANVLAAVVAISVIFLIFNNAIPTSPTLTGQTMTKISMPTVYSYMANVTGNFSTLNLPLVSTGSYMPAQYPGLATYSTSVTHKPIIGGYVTRANATMDRSLLSIPLVGQTGQLISSGNMSYTYPVVESLFNVTLYTLYKYNTSFIVIYKDAFTGPELQRLGTYIEQHMGAPIYVDNTTVAFYTKQYLANDSFNTYISYPAAQEWNRVSSTQNRAIEGMWFPVLNNTEQGTIIVYAPYSNGQGIRYTPPSSNLSTVNTTITFDAATIGSPASAYVAQLTSSGYKTLAAFNVTSKAASYTVNATLLSGTYGNVLAFASDANLTSGNNVVLFSNITFSRS